LSANVPPSWKRAALCLCLLAAPACQQKMAQQPVYRPYEASNFFPDGRSARPIVAGTVSRGQYLDDSPRMTGLTEKGRAARAAAKNDAAAGAEPLPLAGAPNNVANFVEAFPFQISVDDLKRGQARYTAYCTPCHGALGNGGGKIVERGFLRPPSFHTHKLEVNEPDERTGDLPLGYSRGFHRFGVRVSLREVPVGYIFEVISKGFGGMPDYAVQVAPDDRWRIAAYIRALQLSQGATAAEFQAAGAAADGKGGKH
jgi:mono/diheme cytochrome c family protein